MEASNLVIVILFVVAAAAFHFWTKRYARSRAAEPDGPEKFAAKRAQTGAIVNTIVAGILIVVIWSQAGKIPSENRIFALIFVLFGVAWALYGWYRFYKVRRTG